ncbi:MAG: CBS domain-containing protein [Gammaproteobacteria bacterium]
MTKLTAQPLLNTSAHLSRPEAAYAKCGPEDSALTVMTDLQNHRAITISPGETLEFAEKLMIGAGVHLLLVLDSRGLLAGLITYRDLHSEGALTAAARERVSHNALTVAQVMTPATQIETTSLAALNHAQVRDVVELLRQHGRQHALVTETAAGEQVTVRGIFSITQIGHQLGVAINSAGRAQSFAEIEHLLATE